MEANVFLFTNVLYKQFIATSRYLRSNAYKVHDIDNK